MRLAGIEAAEVASPAAAKASTASTEPAASASKAAAKATTAAEQTTTACRELTAVRVAIGVHCITDLIDVFDRPLGSPGPTAH